MHNISTHQKNSRIGILLFSWLLIGFNSFSQTSYTWTGSTSTDWNTSTNWTPNTVPTSVDYVTIRNTTNSPSLSGSVTVAQFSINSSTLTLNGNTLATTNSATFSGSIITSGSILASGSSIDLGTTQFNASITAACEDVFFYGSTFGQSVNLTKTGLSDDYSSGNNSFNAPVTFTLTGYGSMYLEFNNDDYFNSNIIVNCTSYNLDFLSFGENGGGHVYLASGQTITVGSQGFIGYLSLGYFNQLGNTAQNITVTGNGTLSVGNNSVFNGSLTLTAPTLLCGIIILNGPVNFTSPYLDIYDGTYNASAIFNTTGNDSTTFINTGDSAVHSYGGNVFNGDLTINQLGNGLWSEAGAASDTYLGNIVVNTPNNGHVEFGNGENYWGSNNLPSYFTGVTNQSISGTTNNFIIDNLQLIKPSGNLLVNTSVEVSNTLNLQSGNIIMSSPNVLKLDKNIQVSGGSSTSFIDGPVQYTGNKAFTFPCGNGSDYNPISISAPANVTDAFTAQYFHSPQTLGNNIDPTISGLSTCEYWTLNRTGGTDNVSATIGWNASSCDVTSDITKMNVAGWNGTIWKNLGGVGSTGDTSLGTITSASTLTSYGALTLANRAACAFTILPSASSSCEGTSVTLTASGGVTYSWSTGATGATTSVSPSTTTTYTVTGTTSGGCSNTASVTITLPPVTANSTASEVCYGMPVTLTGSGANSYTWSGGVRNGVAFKPTTTTTYTVTGTETGGCKAISTVTITVNPLPIITVAPHDTSICLGNFVTFTSSGAVSYVWTGGITDGVPFAPTATSNYTVTGTDVNGCLNTAKDKVTVDPLPNVVAHANNTVICAGSSVKLTGSGAMAGSYIWTGGVIDGSAFAPSASNTYTVTGTNTNGCSNLASITVTVNPLPTVTANQTLSAVCKGSGTDVMLSGSGAVTYAWTGGVTDGVAFAPNVTKTYTVTGTDANGCTNTSTATITVNPLPVITVVPHDTAICDGTSVTLTATGAVSYSWTGGITNGVAFTPTASSNYTVTGTDVNGCQNTAIDRVSFHTLPKAKVHASATTINAGQSVTLRASGAQNIVWSGGVVNGVAFVPTTTSTYTATVTDAYGCSSTISETVRVRVTGNAQIIVYDQNNNFLCASPSIGNTPVCTVTICQGQSLNFTANAQPASAYVGCWYSCNTPSPCSPVITNPPPQTSGVAWNPSSCDNTINDNNYTALATFTIPGTYIVNFTDYNNVGDIPNAHAAQDVIITVLPPPTVTTSAINSCSGTCNGSITATGSGTSPYTYSWSDPNGQTTQTATNLCAGTYTVTVTNGSGCSGTATGTISIIPPPAVPIISGHNNNCDETATTYSIPSGTTGTITWNVTGNYVNSTQINSTSIKVFWGANVSPLEGNVSVTVNINGCTSTASMDIFPCCPQNARGNPCIETTSLISTPDLNNTSVSGYLYPVSGIPCAAPIIKKGRIGSEYYLEPLSGNPNINVNGTFTVDANLTIVNNGPTQAILLMGGNAKIDIKTGYTLTIETTSGAATTTLEAGCGYMWDGIYVEPGAKLVITSTTGLQQALIQDAENAVVLVNGTAVSKYTINNTVFDKDYIDIIANSYAQGIPATNIISATTFQCTGTLLPPYSSAITLMAIQINSVGNYSTKPGIPSTGITIGDNSSTSFGPNIFNGVTTNMEYGISATSSNVTVQNCQFENIFGTAISFVGVSRRDRILNVLDNPATGVTNTFQNCGAGIQATFSNLSVRNTQMSNIKFVGIQTTDGIVSNTIGIQGNSISMAIGANRNPPVGILDQSTMFSSVQVIHSLNKITNAVYGIYFTNVIGLGGSTGTRIDDNEIYWNSTALNNNQTPYYNFYAGIYLQNCMSMFIDKNSIIKSGSAPNLNISNTLRGIDLENSQSCTVEGNTVALCGSGIYMQDADGQSQLACNRLQSNFYGFNFVGVSQTGATIGNQQGTLANSNPTDNDWLGGAPPAGGNRMFGNISPAVNWFYNPSASKGPNYNPGLYGLGVTFTSLITFNYQISTNADLCSSDPTNRLKFNAQAAKRDTDFGYIVRNTVDFGANDVQIKHFNKNKLYKYFKDNPSILVTGDSSDIIYQHFQDSIASSNIGIFEQVQTYIDSNDVPDAITLNSSVSPTCVQEQNKKTVNDIYLNTWMQNKPYQYTSAQQQALSNLAGQDPILAGDASYSACVMLGTFCPSFSNNGSGQRLAQTSSLEKKQIVGKIYPNPNNGNMIFKYDMAEGNIGTLEIYTITGKIVNTYKLQTGNDILLNITEVSIENGIYFYRQIVNGEALSQGKLVIIK